MTEYINAVEAKDLSKSFGNFTAVDNVNFYIPRGEIFGLLGPNGAGKTTTIRMLCGILNPSSGSGQVINYDIRKEAESIKKNIGYMSQKFSLYNDLTPKENIRFYASIYSVPKTQQKKRIDELIEMSNLSEVQNDLTRNLSGALRQRLALACAIVHEPPMLFLDEATAGVDPVSRREFWDLIYDMAGQGVSVLATTHYMDEAEYCNTIGMMYRGKLVAVASPDTLRSSLSGKLVLVHCEQPLKAAEILEKLPGVLHAELHGVRLHLVLNKSENIDKKIIKELEKNNFKLQKIEEIHPSLEDIFINMVKEQRSE